MSISALNATSNTIYTPPTQTVSANAQAADGDYKAPAAGRVKDSDGDYKTITHASTPPISSAASQALSALKNGG
ncbi:conserved hypothetical protein [Methylocella tundrae]|uniref:Uncharacterized protein n=1 Tax=Methylocella tundrae TaxID=227605 RepID=A0A8B6M2Y9_METTU|nr:hypothetical protein [Methylocella tundrae]VTZ21277.1 conserved hypothetical protein [Methylocella tundrae]VTZ49206.1 conserved hypothetical protein [Methylocella tundrae]